MRDCEVPHKKNRFARLRESVFLCRGTGEILRLRGNRRTLPERRERRRRPHGNIRGGRRERGELINNTSEERKYRARAELLKILREYRQPPQSRTRKIFSLRAAKSAYLRGFCRCLRKAGFCGFGLRNYAGQGTRKFGAEVSELSPDSRFVPSRKFSFMPIVRRGISIASRPPCRPRRAVGILKKVSIFLQPLAAPIRLRRLASKTRAKCAGIARLPRAEARFRPKAPSFRPPVFRFSPTRNILRSRF